MLRRSPILLKSSEERRIVEQAIRNHAEIRRWIILAINVRTNHVHVVVSADPDSGPEKVMAEFKAWATRRLREGGHIPNDLKPWTEHGSTRWINDMHSLESAVEYVLHEQ